MRLFITLLVVATLAALVVHALVTLPQAADTPDFARFVLLFHGVLALPYLVVLVQFARDRAGGLRAAFAASLVNALWSVPLAALLALFAGFALGNRLQLAAIGAAVAGAALQLLLAASAGLALWRVRRADEAEAQAGRSAARAAAGATAASVATAATPAATAPRASGWALAFALPLLCAAAAGLVLSAGTALLRERATLAARNDTVAQKVVREVQACLAARGSGGFPPTLDDCAPDPPPPGYRLDYLPAVAGADGRIEAFQLCAQPLRYRATGFDSVVADSAGRYGAGIAEGATVHRPPTCASLLPIERAIAWCAYAHAQRAPASGYPERLAELRDCVAALRKLRALGDDRAADADGLEFAYLAALPDAQGRRAGFRVYRLSEPGGRVSWLDASLRDGGLAPAAARHPTDPLPFNAAPEPFEPGCAAGNAADCWYAGYEWERREHQAGKADTADGAVLRSAAARAYERGCALGDRQSCTGFGHRHEHGNDVIDRDPVRAVALYEKACELGDGLGCVYAAGMLERGRKARPEMLNPPPPPREPKADLPADPARAVALHQRACSLGERDSCFVAARLLADGEGMPPDRAAALAGFNALCDGGWPQACARAAALAPADAAEYWRRGCVLGDAGACSAGAR